MTAAGVICILIAVIGFFNGGITDFMSAFVMFGFLGVGIALIYFKATEKERFKKRNEERREQIKSEKVRKAHARFDNSPFASQLTKEMGNRNWIDLDYRLKGCQVLQDRIITSTKTYLYGNHNSLNLSVNECELFAIYIGEVYGWEYRVDPIQKGGGLVGAIYVTERTDGDVSVRSDYADSHTIGYSISSQASFESWKKGLR